MLLLSCGIDGDYNFNKYDPGDPMLGGEDTVIRGPLLKESTIYLTDVDFDEIKAENPTIAANSWEELFASGEEIEIPDRFTLDELPLDVDIDDDMIDMLTGQGKIYLYVTAESSLPFDIDLQMNFLTPGGRIDNLFDPIRITGNGGEVSEETPGSKIEVTKEILVMISNEATEVELVAFSDVEIGYKFTVDQNMWVKLSVKFEKLGGIPLGKD